MTDGFKYLNACPICDIETTIIVHGDEDVPSSCPMCGEDAELVELRGLDSDE